ncbi:desmin-like [Osmerus mordax]|uniref:desmin-like n=1 Tax=Osmerus mordax TaxID=8014 RepID=UPI00351057D5
MKDPENDFQPDPSAGFLFIDEEEEEKEEGMERGRETGECIRAPSLLQAGGRGSGTGLGRAPLYGAHLGEMDELLRSCEGLTGVLLGSPLSTPHPDPHPRWAGTDTASDGSSRRPRGGRPVRRIEPPFAPAWMGLGPGGGRARPTHRVRAPRWTGPAALTSAGTELSGTMTEYQTELLGMLAMLESCMEEAGMDLTPVDWDERPEQGYLSLGRNREAQSPPLRPWVEQGEEGGLYGGTCAETGTYVDVRVDVGGSGLCSDPLETGVSMEGPLGGVGDSEGTAATGHMSGVSRGGADPNPLEPAGTGVGVEALGGDREELGALGARLEGCIEEVGRLEGRREELLAEVLRLRGEEGEGRGEEAVEALLRVLGVEAEARRGERMREVGSLRGERREEEGRLARARLERQGWQEETRRLKRRLFAVARDCAHSQVALATQQSDVDSFLKGQEELQSHVAQLTEEVSQLRSAHRDQLASLQARLQAHTSSQTPSPQEELSQCRRHSCGDIQQYLQGGIKALEERYEPVLLGLVKRREGGAGALVKAREQAQELRARLGPLREERQRLELQRVCLEERLTLMDMQRREDVKRHRDMVGRLEESSRQLKTELLVQKRKSKKLEELKDTLNKTILQYRDAIQDHKSQPTTANTTKRDDIIKMDL